MCYPVTMVKIHSCVSDSTKLLAHQRVVLNTGAFTEGKQLLAVRTELEYMKLVYQYQDMCQELGIAGWSLAMWNQSCSAVLLLHQAA